MAETEPGEQITSDIIELVGMRAQQHGLPLDAEPLMRGIASAFVALAYLTRTQPEARAMLLGLVASLDDPPTREWVRTHGKPS